jgi:hypothetical protein
MGDIMKKVLEINGRELIVRFEERVSPMKGVTYNKYWSIEGNEDILEGFLWVEEVVITTQNRTVTNVLFAPNGDIVGQNVARDVLRAAALNYIGDLQKPK